LFGRQGYYFSMLTTIKTFLRDESGATAIEYGLIAAGISIAIITAVKGIGTKLNWLPPVVPAPAGERVVLAVVQSQSVLRSWSRIPICLPNPPPSLDSSKMPAEGYGPNLIRFLFDRRPSLVRTVPGLGVLALSERRGSF
jgi:pilus assembly protein Flp/PilA